MDVRNVTAKRITMSHQNQMKIGMRRIGDEFSKAKDIRLY
jgi:hypothetical protein